MNHLKRFVVSCLLVSGLPLPVGAAEPDAGATQSLPRQGPDGLPAGWKSYTDDPKAPAGNVWSPTAEGVLVCKGKPLGYLYTEKQYKNFKLTLQWRTAPGKTPGRGGVLLRITGPHKIWPKSLEAQLNAGDEGDFWGLDGYKLAGPTERMKTVPQSPFGQLTNLKRAEKAVKAPGEWNRYEIIADGPTVTLKINGREVNRARGCEASAGPICLTAEGDEIHFRDIRIGPLDPAATSPGPPNSK